MNTLLLVVILLVVAGCATLPQQVALNPTVKLTRDIYMPQTPVYVHVVDQRAQKALGVRGDSHAAITTSEDLSVVLVREIKQGLTAKGFVVADESSAQNRFTVTINELRYITEQGSWTDGVKIKGALQAKAQKPSGDLSKSYSYERKEEVLVEPNTEKNERWINDALNEILSRLLNDKELLSFLAAK